MGKLRACCPPWSRWPSVRLSLRRRTEILRIREDRTRPLNRTLKLMEQRFIERNVVRKEIFARVLFSPPRRRLSTLARSLAATLPRRGGGFSSLRSLDPFGFSFDACASDGRPPSRPLAGEGGGPSAGDGSPSLLREGRIDRRRRLRSFVLPSPLRSPAPPLPRRDAVPGGTGPAPTGGDSEGRGDPGDGTGGVLPTTDRSEGRGPPCLAGRDGGSGYYPSSFEGYPTLVEREADEDRGLCDAGSAPVDLRRAEAEGGDGSPAFRTDRSGRGVPGDPAPPSPRSGFTSVSDRRLMSFRGTGTEDGRGSEGARRDVSFGGCRGRDRDASLLGGRRDVSVRVVPDRL